MARWPILQMLEVKPADGFEAVGVEEPAGLLVDLAACRLNERLALVAPSSWPWMRVAVLVRADDNMVIDEDEAADGSHEREGKLGPRCVGVDPAREQAVAPAQFPCGRGRAATEHRRDLDGTGEPPSRHGPDGSGRDASLACRQCQPSKSRSQATYARPVRRRPPPSASAAPECGPRRA